MSHLLYVSPHLDDAVLSCGGSIHSHVASGDRITVTSVFTEGSDGAESLYAARRREDLDVAATLGFEVVHVGLLDAPFRSSSYRDFEGIVYSDGTSMEAAAITRTLADEISTWIARLKPDRLVLPLGVGGHIDHRITFNACASITPSYPLAFYEERPYAFVPGAVQWRWRSLGGRPERSPPTQAQRFSSGWEGLPFLENYMAGDVDPARCMRRLHEQADSLTLSERRAGCWRWRGDAYRRDLHLLEEGMVSALVRAIALYVSQIQDLFLESACDDGAARPPETEPTDGVERMYGLHAVTVPTRDWYEALWIGEAS